MTGDPLLQVRALEVAFPSNNGWASVIHDVSFDVTAGESLGLVGESGSGKTVTSLALLGLTASTGGRIVGGSVRFDGRELVGARPRDLAAVRGARMSMIFQQPMRSLNPAYTVGDQIAEVVRHHANISKRESWRKAIAGLDRVGIPNAERRARDYPHQFSGGMCQRVMIAMALSCGPSLLIADEPTTALDVTVQARVLELLREIQAEAGLSIVFVSHDLGVIAEMCDRVIVMYAGEVVESGLAEQIYERPEHPYTSGLLGSIPRPNAGRRLTAIDGYVPSAGSMPSGCRFHPRCPHCESTLCLSEPIQLRAFTDHEVRCIRSDQLGLTGVSGR